MGSIAGLPPGAPAPQVAKPLSTFERFQWNLYFLLAFDALFLIAVLGAGYVHREALQTIGRNSAPSIIAAQHIKSAVAAIDANAADELLVKPMEGAAFRTNYVRARDEAGEGLIAAAENITYGDSERIPIDHLETGLGDYESAVQRAIDLHDRNDPAAIDAYQVAARIADDKLLPAADSLDDANLNVMERAYAVAKSRDSIVRLAAMVAGFLLLAALIYVQGLISERTRRTLNLPLVVATLAAFLYMAFAYRALTTEANSLKIAKEDAFRSIHLLWQARANAYVARAHLSRYLLGGAEAEADSKAFLDAAGRVAALPVGETFDQVASQATDNRRVENFTGYLAEELRNITFYGELDAAQETLRTWGQTATMYGNVLALERTGQKAQAIKLCTGLDSTNSGAFRRFDSSLGQTLDINQHAFDDAVNRGFAALSFFELTAFIAATLIAALCVLGVWQRLREYL
ncbi:MAG: hypothetical protein WA324_28785 [Bryobacteraceae bacterium]